MHARSGRSSDRQSQDTIYRADIWYEYTCDPNLRAPVYNRSSKISVYSEKRRGRQWPKSLVVFCIAFETRQCFILTIRFLQRGFSIFTTYHLQSTMAIASSRNVSSSDYHFPPLESLGWPVRASQMRFYRNRYIVHPVPLFPAVAFSPSDFFVQSRVNVSRESGVASDFFLPYIYTR